MRGAEQAVVGLQLEQHMLRPIGVRQGIAMQPLQHARHVDRVARRLAVRGLEPRQLEQVGNDGVHALCLRAHVADRARPGLIDGGIIGQRVEIARDHGQRRAQLVRGIGDEILAHGLEAHLARHIAHQQQRLAGAVGHDLQREIQVRLAPADG